MSFYIFCDFFYFCAQRNILYFKEQFTTVEEAILQKTLSETLLYAPVFLKIHFVRQFWVSSKTRQILMLGDGRSDGRHPEVSTFDELGMRQSAHTCMTFNH